jgi:hypothetical protein
MSGRDKRRLKRRRGAGKDYRTVSLGNGVEQARPDEVLRAMGALPPDLDWEAMARAVIPILPRRRPLPPLAGQPFRVTLPPGIPTGFGIDIGPALLVVGSSLLETWPVGPAELVAQALDNLRDRVRPVRQRDVLHETIDGEPVRLLQTGVGCASALLLVPDELGRIVGTGHQLLLAPMRDLLVALPGDVDRGFAAWLNDELAALDPNGLALDGFVLDAGDLRYEPLGPRPGADPSLLRP